MMFYNLITFTQKMTIPTFILNTVWYFTVRISIIYLTNSRLYKSFVFTIIKNSRTNIPEHILFFLLF